MGTFGVGPNPYRTETPQKRLDRLKDRIMQCRLPPSGWRCSRRPGHAGPCAADEVFFEGTETVMTGDRLWAYQEANKIADFGDDLGEPVHPFVRQRIEQALMDSIGRRMVATLVNVGTHPNEPGTLTDKVSER